MKRSYLYTLSLTLLCLLLVETLAAWGFRSHRNINAAAIDGLPEPLKSFFQTHREFIVDQSVAPDLRRRDDPAEGPNHYINFERFGTYLFPEFPVDFDEAVSMYDIERLSESGLIIWRIGDWYDSLTSAFRNGDIDRILFFASDLGHYLADLHMPLHTTINHDGQATSQRGIHRRFETDLPERFDSSYVWELPSYEMIENPRQTAFEIGLESFGLIERIYQSDLATREGIAEDLLFRAEQKEGRTVYIYYDIYFLRFYEALDGMVEDRLGISARRLRDYWCSAWVRAGKTRI